MSPVFRFMTGATQYRITAGSREEALRIAFEDLRPTEHMKAIILQTLYDEEDALRFAPPDIERKQQSLRVAEKSDAESDIE
jgi:hypothetical protein